jgi:hypothetical protein
MADLTPKGRKRIKEANFAVKKGGEKKYPVHDEAHARNALARVAQHGTPAEKKAVKAKVAKKYPKIGKDK